MIKVLYITNYTTLYGANKSLLGLMTLLREDNLIEPILLVTGAVGPLGTVCEYNNIKVLNCDFRNRTVYEEIPFKHLKKKTRNAMLIVDALKVNKFLRINKVEFDIVHSNSSIIDVGYYLAKWNGKPHVWHIREFLKDDYQEEIVYSRNKIAQMYLRTEKVIAISDSIREYIRSYDERIRCVRIYNGINICSRYKKVYFQNDEVNICIVGVVKKSKNQFDVLKAVYKLIKENYKIHLHIIGDCSGEYADMLKCFVTQNKLENVVSFYGYCDNVDEMLKRMDVGIMASEREAFGRVTVEYMANYMSVIGTDTGANRELIDDLMIYPLHDVDRLAELLRLLIDDEKLLNRTGLNNRIKSEFFDSVKNAKEIMEIYLQLLEGC